MKKILTLCLLLAGIGLIAYSYQQGAPAISPRTKEKAISPERQAVLDDPNANFPQLSTNTSKDQPQVRLVTSQGAIDITLFPQYAPLAVENFLTHSKEGYYDGLTFHRVIKDFMIQTGDPKGDGSGGESIWAGKDKSKDSGRGFVNEISPYLYNLRGAVSMANAGADTNGSQFFINQNPTDSSQNLSTDLFPQKIIQAYKKGGNPSLDGSYTVFGQVTKGMEVVDTIAQSKTDDQDKPLEAITIDHIEVLSE